MILTTASYAETLPSCNKRSLASKMNSDAILQENAKIPQTTFPKYHSTPGNESHPDLQVLKRTTKAALCSSLVQVAARAKPAANAFCFMQRKRAIPVA